MIINYDLEARLARDSLFWWDSFYNSETSYKFQPIVIEYALNFYSSYMWTIYVAKKKPHIVLESFVVVQLRWTKVIPMRKCAPLI